MGIYELILVALAIGMDSFSVSVGIGVTGIDDSNKIFKFSLITGVLHFLLPLVGLYLGTQLSGYLGQFATYFGAGVLILLGINMIRENHKETKIEFKLIGTELLLIPLSVSLDALTIGFGLGTLGMSVLEAATFFGAVAFLMTILGLTLGNVLGAISSKFDLVGGVILIGLGVKLLIF
ncbi:putative membrane protein [Halobacteroides halobius DSM 5150]|uniref:Putative manganese efflux pump MntP n=1 Tax=Halobacteroides halobius (strain ATCC 35273 / DSM 5150 / MD-1) TaxID=748449 RepID=L0KE51_HALHC|nr:manganese efflux pump MntP family protein [Halobacteroides halobius]AGB42348.1 putative membrane protein [Halobacteroides halobius DSM 5150]